MLGPELNSGLLNIEVSDSPNGIFGPWARWTRAPARCPELLGRRRRRRRRHLEIQVDIQARKLCLEVSQGFELLVKDLGEWRPGFYIEFRCASREHSSRQFQEHLQKII